MTRRLIALMLLVSLSARAAGPSPEIIREAKRRFVRANQLYQDGRYGDALHLYQAAYDLVPSPDILFNLGLAKEKVFDYEGCLLSFQQYLHDAQDATRRAQAKARVEHCREQTLVPVKVSSLPGSAAVVIGEGNARSTRGRTPAVLNLKPGVYQLTVEAPGYVPQKQALTVEAGVHPDVDFTLEKLSTMHIEADVSGADVLLDGEPQGTTPLQREIKAGLYHVEVSKPGHRMVTRQVRVNQGDQVSLVISLPVLARERLLAIALDRPSSAPAEVRLDGDPLGTVPLERRVVAGEHRLQIQSSGRLPLDANIRVAEDRDLRLAVHLTRRRTRAQRGLFWSLELAATAAASVGLAFGILALENQSNYSSRPTVALGDTGRAQARTADISFGASAVLGLTGAIYALVTWPRHSSAAPVR